MDLEADSGSVFSVLLLSVPVHSDLMAKAEGKAVDLPLQSIRRTDLRQK